jgi:hypothetical protein
MKSQLMTQAELARLQASGKILEQDERGIKVTLLPDGNILKVFRLRRWFSSGLIYSTARRFCRNALRLKKLGIPTVTVISLHHVENCNLKTIKYAPLAGETIRDLLKSNQLTEEMFEQLGAFVAGLHCKGIYFRSLHCGNIVRDENRLGLIDVADMRIYPWVLFQSTRLRNFKHFYRYADDISVVKCELWQIFFEAYFESCYLNQKQQSRFERTLYPYFGLTKLN